MFICSNTVLLVALILTVPAFIRLPIQIWPLGLLSVFDIPNPDLLEYAAHTYSPVPLTTQMLTT